MSLMRRRGAKRTAGVVGVQPAAVIAYNKIEMWTCRQARRRWGKAGFVGTDGGGSGAGWQSVGRF